jgi:hypothetical protein
MQVRILAVALLFLTILPNSAHAVTVKRNRLVNEQITIRQLFTSLVRGFGIKKLQEETQGDPLDALKAAIERLNLDVESIEFTLQDGKDRTRTLAITFAADAYQLKVIATQPGFELESAGHLTQVSKFWATVRGYRVHFRQELIYNRGGFVGIEIKILNSVDRVNQLRFYADLYERKTGEETRIETSLTVGACVPGRPCGLIHRIAANKIACKSDQTLIALDRKVRELVATGNEGNWLEFVPILAERAVARIR